MTIQRKLINDILPWLGTKQIIGIKGTRRAGKTTLLHDIENILKEKGDQTVFFSVEQKKYLPIFSNPKLFIKFLKEQHNLGNGKKLYVFLDEFQYIPNAVSFLKEIHDLFGDSIQLITAASTTFKVTKDITDLEPIRKIFYLHRLSFFEYINRESELSYTKKFLLSEEKELKEFYTLYKHNLEEHIHEYIKWGGYPEVITEKDTRKKIEILGDIIHHHIEKDIANFLRIENVSAYIQLMEILSHKIGHLLNHNDLSTRLGIHKKTLSKYLDIIEGTFTFLYVPPYFTDTKKELAKMNKIYAQDMGILSYFLQEHTHSPISNTLHSNQIKNFIFTQLRKHHHTNNLYFYRTIAQAEIDFVLCKDKEIIPIKIKFGKKKQKVPVVMKNFIKKYQNITQKGIIITQNELRFEKDCVFVPFTLFPFLDI